VLIAHHTAKPPRGDGRPARASANDARGASALKDGVRWVANLEALDGGDARLSVTKSNYGPAGAPVHLTRDFDQGGYLRILTNEERRQREAAQVKQLASERTELEERIIVALDEVRVSTKENLSKVLGVRAQLVRQAVDHLTQTGQIEKAGRLGVRLSGALTANRPRPSPPSRDASSQAVPDRPTVPPLKEGDGDGLDGRSGVGTGQTGRDGQDGEAGVRS
jgi:hypothetical protein